MKSLPTGRDNLDAAAALTAELHPRDPAADLRYLLARRLARAHRFQEAQLYYPPEVQADYVANLAGCERAFDAPGRPANAPSGSGPQPRSCTTRAWNC